MSTDMLLAPFCTIPTHKQQRRSTQREFRFVYLPENEPPALPVDLALDGVRIEDWNAFWNALQQNKKIYSRRTTSLLLGLFVTSLVALQYMESLFVRAVFYAFLVPALTMAYFAHRTYKQRIHDICHFEGEQQMFRRATTLQYSVHHGDHVFPKDPTASVVWFVDCITFNLITTAATTTAIGSHALLPPPSPPPYYYPLYYPPGRPQFEVPEMPEGMEVPIDQWISFWTEIKASVDAGRRHQLVTTIIGPLIVATVVVYTIVGVRHQRNALHLATVATIGIVLSCFCLYISSLLNHEKMVSHIENLCELVNDLYFHEYGYKLECVYSSVATGASEDYMITQSKCICLVLQLESSNATGDHLRSIEGNIIPSTNIGVSPLMENETSSIELLNDVLATDQENAMSSPSRLFYVRHAVSVRYDARGFTVPFNLQIPASLFHQVPSEEWSEFWITKVKPIIMEAKRCSMCFHLVSAGLIATLYVTFPLIIVSIFADPDDPSLETFFYVNFSVLMALPILVAGFIKWCAQVRMAQLRSLHDMCLIKERQLFYKHGYNLTCTFSFWGDSWIQQILPDILSQLFRRESEFGFCFYFTPANDNSVDRTEQNYIEDEELPAVLSDDLHLGPFSFEIYNSGNWCPVSLQDIALRKTLPPPYGLIDTDVTVLWKEFWSQLYISTLIVQFFYWSFGVTVCLSVVWAMWVPLHSLVMDLIVGVASTCVSNWVKHQLKMVEQFAPRFAEYDLLLEYRCSYGFQYLGLSRIHTVHLIPSIRLQTSATPPRDLATACAAPQATIREELLMPLVPGNVPTK